MVFPCWSDYGFDPNLHYLTLRNCPNCLSITWVSNHQMLKHCDNIISRYFEVSVSNTSKNNSGSVIKYIWCAPVIKIRHERSKSALTATKIRLRYPRPYTDSHRYLCSCLHSLTDRIPSRIPKYQVTMAYT